VGRRLGRFAAAILIFAFATGVLAWVGTPMANDIQQRVAGLARGYGVAVLNPAQVPKQLAQAVVATEDERFYHHHGIDLLGVSRAFLDDLRNRCLCEGGSTLTQQLVKEVYLGGSDRGTAKLADMAVAFKVENVISKDRIMADWLSLAPTGPTLYGAGTASCAYFGRPLGKLDLAQYALLAGIPRSPVADDPLKHPGSALRRRSEVIDAMVSERFITAAQGATAKEEPLLGTPGPGC
jgi:penicillin-binding protein 1A